jgi:hypothetical protein
MLMIMAMYQGTKQVSILAYSQTLDVSLTVSRASNRDLLSEISLPAVDSNIHNLLHPVLLA